MPQIFVAENKIDRYLEDLAAALDQLGSDQVRDIVEELRSHITDKVTTTGQPTAASISSVLATLGDPRDLASLYLDDDARAEFRSTGSAARLSGKSFASPIGSSEVFARIRQTFWYLLGGVIVCAALFKPVHPHTAGLWMIPDPTDRFSFSLSLGFHSLPPGSKDILGWWIVPIGLVTAFALWLPTGRLGWGISRRSQQAPTLRLR